MSVITVIKKIGDKIVSVVEWPIKHSEMLIEMLEDWVKDAPQTKADVVTLVQMIEAMGPDALAAIAAKGFDIPDDMKTVADIQGLFTYITGTLMPAIESDYADFKKAALTGSSSAAPSPSPSPAPAPSSPAPAEPVPAAPVVAAVPAVDPTPAASTNDEPAAQAGPGLHAVFEK